MSDKMLKNTPPGMQPVIVKNIKDAKRLLARLIKLYQLGEVDEKYVKTLAYLLNQYCYFHKVQTETDKIEEIERMLKEFERVKSES